MKQRLDLLLVARGLVTTRSQAESWIRLGRVFVNGHVARKPGAPTEETAQLELQAPEQFVSRAGLKLASAAKALHVDFGGKTVLDVGSSTGGFTDYALQHGAVKVVAVEVGTDQLHPSLHGDPRIELHEQTDIRDVVLQPSTAAAQAPLRAKVLLNAPPDLIVADVSFISLREIIPHLLTLCSPQTMLLMMVKPQFEAAAGNVKHKGVIKNDHVRRDILKDFEAWVLKRTIIVAKADSEVPGARGNVERFYLLRPAGR